MSAAKTPPPVPHVRIPKPLYDDLLRGRFTANQAKVVLCVMRWTIGHKGQACGAYVSRQFIADKTQLQRRSVRAVMDELLTEGVLVQVQPAAGRRPAVIALQQDASRWGVHSPDAAGLSACQRANKAGHLSAYQRANKAKPFVGAISTLLPGLLANVEPEAVHSEVLSEEEHGEHDNGGSAKAPPSSCVQERPRSFDLPGFGDVYEHDRWALDQPDSRDLYIKAFGEPSGNGDRP